MFYISIQYDNRPHYVAMEKIVVKSLKKKYMQNEQLILIDLRKWANNVKN